MRTTAPRCRVKSGELLMEGYNEMF